MTRKERLERLRKRLIEQREGVHEPLRRKSGLRARVAADEAERTAPAGDDRDVLHAVHGVRDRRP